MGASSSGLLDEAKISTIKGLVDSKFQSFSVFYRQQYSAAYFGHLHQEVEPKKEGRGLLLTHGPHYAPEEVLYKGCVKFSCWDEQGKKCREKYTVLRRDYKVEIHENLETFSRGCAAKLVLQTAGGSVFTTEGESRAHLEKTCAGVLNEVKEDSSSVVSSPDVFTVYLHLPYMGYTCFLFQQEEERDHFLSALKTCIRHCNLDPWSDSSYESQAYVQALRVYRQDKGCYESWEMLLGTEEKVLASQVMEEVLPWLQSQLQSRVKGKKTERIRQWLATVQATYTLVLEQLTASLEALREECRQIASANQALIRSDLDQIMTSHCFLEEKVRACIHEEAEKVCSESVAPYLSSILEALTDNISAGIQGMQHTLHTQMDSAFTHTNGETGDTKKALSTLRSISLSQCYRQVENLTEQFEGLKQRFGMSSTQRLVHSAHLEMEKLLDSAVYTLELFLQSSARLQPSQIPVKMERAKERVLKQLDYDSRVVQRRLYEEALLEITVPALTRGMDSKWKTELQQFEQYIFSDYSSFILVHNAYDDVLRDILSKEIETVVQDAASKKSNNLLLDTSDLAISQYSLLGQTPPRSTPGSPAIHARDSSSAPNEEPPPVVEEGGQTVTADTKSDPSAMQSSDQCTVLLSPVIVVTQQCDESATEEASCLEETQKQVQPETDAPPTTAESSSSATPDTETGHDVVSPDAPANPTDASASPPDGTADLNDASANPLDAPANLNDASADPTYATNPSDASASPLDATANPPDATYSPPDATANPPNATHSPPNATADLRDASAKAPDASANPPDTPDNLHDAPAEPTDASVKAPDASANPPDAPADPAYATNPPDAPAKQPDASANLPDDPVNPSDDFTDPILDTPDLSMSILSSLESTDVPSECAQSDRSATPENSATPDPSTSDQETEHTTSDLHPCPSPSPPPGTDSPMKISLGSLSEAIGCNSTTPLALQTMAKQPTDRAVYLTGEIKDNWEMERVKEETLTQAAKEKEGEEETEAGKGNEEETGMERVEGQMGGVAQTGGEPVKEGIQSSKTPAESATSLTTEVKESGEKGDEGKGSELEMEERIEDEEGPEERGDHADSGEIEEKKEEEDLQSPKPMESQPESVAELPLDSVAIIRELVTEITEVETIISPCPNSSQTP